MDTTLTSTTDTSVDMTTRTAPKPVVTERAAREIEQRRRRDAIQRALELGHREGFAQGYREGYRAGVKAGVEAASREEPEASA